MVYLEKRFTTIQMVLLVVGLALSLFYASHQILTGDQTQMLYKGYMAAYKDVWINYGNSASAVGKVPGSMITYVVALPVMLFNSPWSPMLFLILLHVASYFLLDSVIKKIFTTDIRLVFLILYWLNPWFVFENILYNPSYLFFFASLHLYTAYKQQTQSSFLYSFLHVLSIGLALQFHYSWIILAFISLYLMYKKMVKVHWFGVMAGILVIGISLVPYLQEVMHNSAIVHHEDDTGRYIGWGGVHVYPVVKSFLYWLRYGSFFFPNKLMTSANFDWLTTSHLVQIVLTYAYKAIVITVGAFTVYISYKANRLFYKRLKGKYFARELAIASQEEWLLLYVFGAMVGVFVSSVLSPIIFSYWHLIIVFPFAIIPLLVYAKPYMKKYLKSFVLFTLVYFLMINLMGAIDSRKYDLHVNYVQDVKQYIAKSVGTPE